MPHVTYADAGQVSFFSSNHAIGCDQGKRGASNSTDWVVSAVHTVADPDPLSLRGPSHTQQHPGTTTTMQHSTSALVVHTMLHDRVHIHPSRRAGAWKR